MSKFPNWSVLFIVTLVIFSLGVIGFGAEEGISKLDPTLRRLVERNNKSLEEKGEPLNLGPYADKLEVYMDSEAVQVERKGLKHDDGTTKYEYVVPEGAEGYRLGVLIEASSSTLVEAKGVPVRTVTGDIMTATASLKQIEELAHLKSVNYVEASRRVQPELNESVPLVGAAKLHKDNPVLRGEGVVVGVVDSGIDYDHKDFRVDKNNDGDEETSRIQYIWDQAGNSGNGGPGPPPTTFGYGTEYTKSQIESDIADGFGPFSGKVREADTEGHGTHVIGIEASDGSSNPDPSKYPTYTGMAPEADIIMVKTDWWTSSIIDGVNYIFQKADNLGKSAVVNLSLGSKAPALPYDGTSLMSKGVDELTGPGKIVVVSAGNAGSYRWHAGESVSSGSSSTVDFEVAGNNGFALGIWYPGESDFTVTVTSPDDSLSVASGDFQSSSEIFIDNASAGPDSRNNDKLAYVEGKNTYSNPKPWSVTISASSGTEGGRFDSWIYGYGEFLPPEGNSRMTTTPPGTAKNVITAGASMTRTSWIGADNNEHSYVDFGVSDEGNIAPFSSRGPTRDGRLKPEVTAPGMGIASTLAGTYANMLKSNDPGFYNTVVTEDKKHFISQGTSMSAPMVSGQVTLMLQQDSDLPPSEVKKKLTNTASTDKYTSVGFDVSFRDFTRSTGSTPNNTWGYGKLNSVQSSRTLGLGTEKLDELEVQFGPNPATSGDKAFLYYQIPSSGTFKVFNASGRQVYSASLDSNQSVHEWSLVNETSEPLANGIYLYVVAADGQSSEIGKIMVERK